MNFNASAYYKIISKQTEDTNQCVSVFYDGSIVQQADREASNQLWRFLPTGTDDEYYIVAKDSGNCLEVLDQEIGRNGVPGERHTLSLSSIRDFEDQKWFMTPVDAGYVYIYSKSQRKRKRPHKSLCLDLRYDGDEPSSYIIAFPWKRPRKTPNDRQNQKWAIKEVLNVK